MMIRHDFEFSRHLLNDVVFCRAIPGTANENGQGCQHGTYFHSFATCTHLMVRFAMSLARSKISVFPSNQ